MLEELDISRQLDYYDRRIIEQLFDGPATTEQLQGLRERDRMKYVLAACILNGEAFLGFATGFTVQQGLDAIERVFPFLTEAERNEIMVEAQRTGYDIRPDFDQDKRLVIHPDAQLRNYVRAVEAYRAGRPVRLEAYGDPHLLDPTQAPPNPYQLLGQWLNEAGHITSQLLTLRSDERAEVLAELAARTAPEPQRSWFAKAAERQHASRDMSERRGQHPSFADQIIEAGDDVVRVVLALCEGLSPHFPRDRY